MRSEQTEEMLVGMDALHQNSEAQYVRSGDGKFYLEVRNPNGGTEYLQAEPGLAFREMSNGKFQAIRSVEQYEKMRDPESHKAFFTDEKGAKNTMKRQSLLEKQLQNLMIERVSPPPIGPRLEVIKDEHLEALQKEYQQAVAAGEPHLSEFQPLSSYAHKLITRSGKVIRPLYQGEVGMKGSTVVVLERGYGTGGFSAVPLIIGGK